MSGKDPHASERAHWRSVPRGRPRRVEKPGPGQESVWDYPRPPRVERVSRRIRVELFGAPVADSTRGLRVCETASPPTYYVPAEDVRMDLLEASELRSFCEWKGEARYWSARRGDRFVENVAWSYPVPAREFAALADHLAFFAGRVDACYLADQRVTPQPGGFYGGWVTPEVRGPFKGEPGTQGW